MIGGVVLGILMLGIVMVGRYFVSVEFWLYPYLIKQGLVPYVDLIDQHLPGVLFGPLSFSSIGVVSHTGAVLSFVALLFAIAMGFWIWQKTMIGSHRRTFLTGLVFVFGYYLLGGEHMWIEQWSLLGMIAGMVLSRRRGVGAYVAGLILAWVFVNRPFAIGWLGVMFMLSSDKKRVVAGIVTYAILLGLWFVVHDNLAGFLAMMELSGREYLELSAKWPNVSQIAWSSAVLLPVVYLMRPQGPLLLAFAIGLMSAWPRFESYHLVFSLLGLGFVRQNAGLIRIGVVVVVLGVLVGLRVWPIGSISFYLGDEVLGLAEKVGEFKTAQVYIFGGPDQVYTLSNTMPAGSYYLPSLSWYHADIDLVDRQIEALERAYGELVVVNRSSVVDGVNLIDASPRIYNYVLRNYTYHSTWGNYDFYLESARVAKSK